MHEEESNEEEYIDDVDSKSTNNVAPEYKRLIAIHAGKPKGGLVECLKVDPNKVRRLSLSEQQLEKASETYGKEIVRYLIKIFCELCCISFKFHPSMAWHVKAINFNYNKNVALKLTCLTNYFR